MTIVLKVKFGDDTRRLTLEKEPTYEELQDLLRKLYVNLPTAYGLKYIDEDEDQITIGSDLELTEAIRVSGGPIGVLRLFITGVPLASQAASNQPQSLPDLLKAFSPPTATNPEVPELVNLFQNLGINTSVPSTNDPEQLRSHMKTLFQQLLSSPFIFNLIPTLMPYLPQITAFLSSFEETVKKESVPKEQVKSDVVHEGVICDNCSSPITGIRYKCSQCWNFDLCESCEKQGSHDKNHILLKIQLPIQHQQFGRGCPYNRNQNNNNNHPHGRWRHKFQKKNLSRYVADVTIPDGSRITTSSTFVKIWRMRNEGQTLWPPGTILEHVGGDQLSVQSRVVLDSAVEPGAEVDISVDMIAPSAPGRYVSFWKLVDTDGVAFGQRVWADICVENVSDTNTLDVMSDMPVTTTTTTGVKSDMSDEEALNVNLDNLSVTEAVKTVTEETVMDLPSSPTSDEFVVISSANGELEDKVVQLRDMGFGDLDLNRRLLVTHNLDMVKTVQELLNN